MNELKLMHWRINLDTSNTTDLPHGWDYRLNQIKQHIMMAGCDIMGLLFEGQGAEPNAEEAVHEVTNQLK